MLIVIAGARTAPGRAARNWSPRQRVTEATRRDRGCHTYGFYADVTNPDAILSVEVWRDQAALDEHLSHDHTHAFIRTVPALVAGEPVMHFYNAEPAQESN